MAIVTGASRGIGRAISLRLATDGCIVALIARDVDALAEVQAEIEKAGGTFYWLKKTICSLHVFKITKFPINDVENNQKT